jgi:hypothetical protein
VEHYVSRMKTVDTIRRRLATVIRQQRDLLDELSRVVTNGGARVGEQERLQARLQKLMAEHQRLTDDLKLTELESRDIPGTRRVRASGRTLREQTLDILDEIGVPLAPSAIAEFANATTGAGFQASRFASLRRDEERASRRDPLAKPAWVVPALSAEKLTPIPRLLTSSAWPAERRLIGARTLRVNHLRAVLAYLKRHELMQSVDPTRAEVLVNLIWRQARAVPGATIPGEEPDPVRIRVAVESELSIIEPDDEAHRQRALPSLHQLAPLFQLWGCPALIDGAAAPRSGT